MSRIWFLLAHTSARLGALFGFSIIVYQCVTWVLYGHWQPISISTALDQLQISHPVMQWAGAQQLIDDVLSWPASLAVLVAGAFAAWLFGSLGLETKRQAEVRRALNDLKAAIAETA
jgi:hypothetical protein